MAGRPRKSRENAKKDAGLRLYAHQQNVVDAYVKNQFRRFFLAWHRRAGKDVFTLDFIRERMKERVGNYWHLFPFHVQAKRAIWKGIDARTGERFIDRAFPDRLRARDNETEMSIVMPNGSTWQMLGSDNYDRMVGSNPCGIAFSEWALCDPAAWDYIRPILLENKGFALFITTFRGRNHAWRMFQQVKNSEGWFAEIRTVNQTQRHDGSPIVTPEDIQKEIDEGMDPALVRQEFYCDPDAASAGAVFTRQYSRLMALDPQRFAENSRVLRVAWGMQGEGITGIVFQNNHVLSVNAFLESNITDCVQAITRRHPHSQLIHHAKNPDPQLFQCLDGHGLVNAQLNPDEHMRQGFVANLLNGVQAVSAARESLADFAMSYAPYRETPEEQLTHPATCEALAVMSLAQFLSKSSGPKKLDYSRYDRGVI